jgi:hypothetical protein
MLSTNLRTLLIGLVDTIRWWNPMESPETTWPEGSLESQEGFFNEDDMDNPHSYCPRPAPQVLQELVDKYRALEWIPKRNDWAQIIEEGIDEVCYFLI